MFSIAYTLLIVTLFCKINRILVIIHSTSLLICIKIMLNKLLKIFSVRIKKNVYLKKKKTLELTEMQKTLK